MKELKEAGEYSERQIEGHSGVVQGEFPAKPGFAAINFIIWGMVYGFFALRYDDDPEVCYAASGKDLRVTDSKISTS